MALANAVQNAMTGGKGNLAVGVVTLSVVVLAAWCRTRLLVRSPGLERAFIGSPTILIHRGRVFTDHLRRQRFDVDELKAAVRGYGNSDLRDVQTAVLEVDGSISVIPYPQKQDGGD
ncbi:MAG TPA: YetF domain-containing protein [Actinomycetota bacterium]|nr:YetF domain-containing protein [Actinomycetota bacterium]